VGGGLARVMMSMLLFLRYIMAKERNAYVFNHSKFNTKMINMGL
jgi:hypothetical protein